VSQPGRREGKAVITVFSPGAKLDFGIGADAMRHLYDHAGVVSELRGRARASVTCTHDATVPAASLGEGGAASTGAGADR
jgi:hypothetical protein